MAADVVYEVAGGVARITIDRPDIRNALAAEVVNGLGDGLVRAAEDDAVRVVVLTGTGTTFCAGADLKGTSREEPRYTLPQLLDLIQLGPTPVIGRINGSCTGGGVGLAAACDISVVDDTAAIGFTEVRIGVAPAIIAVVCLPKLGRADAADLMLSGEKVPATRAAAVGLFNTAVPAADLDAEVDAVVSRLLRGGPEALAATKSLLHGLGGRSREDAFTWTAALSAERFASAEAAEGMAAFRERRPPSWVPDGP